MNKKKLLTLGLGALIAYCAGHYAGFEKGEKYAHEQQDMKAHLIMIERLGRQ